MELNDILEKYGSYGRTGRVIFKQYAYILVSKKLGIDFNQLNQNQKAFLKGDMIDQFVGTGYIKDSY